MNDHDLKKGTNRDQKQLLYLLHDALCGIVVGIKCHVRKCVDIRIQNYEKFLLQQELLQCCYLASVLLKPAQISELSVPHLLYEISLMSGKLRVWRDNNMHRWIRLHVSTLGLGTTHYTERYCQMIYQRNETNLTTTASRVYTLVANWLQV